MPDALLSLIPKDLGDEPEAETGLMAIVPREAKAGVAASAGVPFVLPEDVGSVPGPAITRAPVAGATRMVGGALSALSDIAFPRQETLFKETGRELKAAAEQISAADDLPSSVNTVLEGFGTTAPTIVLSTVLAPISGTLAIIGAGAIGGLAEAEDVARRAVAAGSSDNVVRAKTLAAALGAAALEGVGGRGIARSFQGIRKPGVRRLAHIADQMFANARREGLTEGFQRVFTEAVAVSYESDVDIFSRDKFVDHLLRTIEAAGGEAAVGAAVGGLFGFGGAAINTQGAEGPTRADIRERLEQMVDEAVGDADAEIATEVITGEQLDPDELEQATVEAAARQQEAIDALDAQQAQAPIPDTVAPTEQVEPEPVQPEPVAPEPVQEEKKAKAKKGKAKKKGRKPKKAEAEAAKEPKAAEETVEDKRLKAARDALTRDITAFQKAEQAGEVKKVTVAGALPANPNASGATLHRGQGFISNGHWMVLEQLAPKPLVTRFNKQGAEGSINEMPKKGIKSIMGGLKKGGKKLRLLATAGLPSLAVNLLTDGKKVYAVNRSYHEYFTKRLKLEFIAPKTGDAIGLAKDGEIVGAVMPVAFFDRSGGLGSGRAVTPLEDVEPAIAATRIVPPPQGDPSPVAEGDEELGAPGPLEEVQSALRETVNAKTPLPKPKVGLAVEVLDAPLPGQVAGGDYAFADPETEARFQEARKGIRAKTDRLTTRIRTFLREQGHRMTREFEHLPRTAFFAPIRNELQKLTKQAGISQDQSIRNIQAITIDLKSNELLELFERKVLLDDLMFEASQARKLPFKFTHESVQIAHAEVTARVNATPEVKAAVAARTKLWTALTNEYIARQKEAGFDVGDRLNNPAYFRHQVLTHAAESRPAGRAKLRLGTARSFLRKRTGSLSDINARYIEAEHEVMAQMLHDIETAKVVTFVNKNYNVITALKAQARAANEAAVLPLFEKVAEEINESLPEGREALTAEDAMRRVLNTKQAIGWDQLGDVALSEFGLPSNFQFDNVVEWITADARLRNEAKALAKEEGVSLDEALVQVGSPAELGLQEPTSAETFAYLGWLIREHGGEPGSGAAATIFKGISEKKKFIQDALGTDYKTWEDLVDDNHAIYQPREGDVMYRVTSVSERIAQEALDKSLSDSLKVPIKELRTVLARGGKFKPMVLPVEIVETLEDLRPLPPKRGMAKVAASALRFWKGWVLTNVRRVLPYNARNLSGDLDASIWNPRSLLHVKRSAKELFPAFFSNRALVGEVNEWHKRGGFNSGLTAQELGDINNLRVFENLADRLDRAPTGKLNRLLDITRIPTDYREAILRYANYLEYLDQVESNDGVPRNYGASIREEVDAIDDPRDKAFKLSNELVGAYDSIGVTGQWLRANPMPFWSWKEVNMRRFIGLIRNAHAGPTVRAKLAAIVGAKALIGVPASVLRVMFRFTVKVTALEVLLSTWNQLFFPDEEDDLDEVSRSRLHFIVGRDAPTEEVPEGKVRVYTQLGALEDALAWFGADIFPAFVRDVITGRRSLKEALTRMAADPPDVWDVTGEVAQSTINELLQSLRPEKAVLEVALGRGLFPDFRSPKPIRDPGLYLSRQWALGNEYRAIDSLVQGKPSRPYMESIEDILFRRIDPGQGKYWDIQRESKRWLREEKGIRDESFYESPRGTALYNFKQAARWGDDEMRKRWWLRYLAEGGSTQGLAASKRLGEPLGGLNKAQRAEFIAQLRDDQKETLRRAQEWYGRLWKQKN